MAKALNSVQEMVIRSILPWCLMPELYAAKPEFVQSLADFARSRPPQSVASFIQQSNAVLAYDAEAQLRRVTVPTSTTFGLNDMVTSTRFASRLKEGIPNSEVLIFEECAHAPIYEKIEEFNGKSLNFMKRHARVESSQSA
jgi:3-oxoadipate enol-lactonase